MYHAETGGYDVDVDLDLRIGAAYRRTAEVLPLPAPGADRDAGPREGAGRVRARAQVLPHDDGRDRRTRPSAPSVTEWSASPAGSSSGPGTTGKRCTRRSSAQARSSGSGWRVRERTRPTPSSRAGSLLHCLRSTRGTSSGRTGSGCPQPDTRARRRSAAASCPSGSTTTTSRPGISGTGATSSSTTTSSGVRRSHEWPRVSTAGRSRSHWTTRT